jgi:hypothetical protein
MSTARNVMAMVSRYRGFVDPNEQLPDIPDRVTPPDSLPRTPPEALARIAQTKVNIPILNRLHAQAAVYLQDEQDPVLDLAIRLARDAGDLPKRYDNLAKAHGTMGDPTKTSQANPFLDELKLELANRPTPEAVDKLQKELDTVKADLEQHRKDLAERPTQKAFEDLQRKFDIFSADIAARNENVGDVESKLEKSRRTILDIKEDHKQQDARRETSAQRSMYDQIQLVRRNTRLWKEKSTLQRQLKAARKKVKQSTALFRILSNNVEYMEELFKSYLWYANTDRNQTERDSARLQRQNDEQTRKYERLHADAVEDLRDQTTTSEEIRMYKWAWSETMRFIYHLLGLDTEDMTDDPSESVLDITQRRLRQCQVVKYEIDKTQKECMDKYEAVCERWKNSKECFQQLNEAMVMIKSLTSDVSRYKTVAITQEARYQATLRERNMFALALRDTKSQFNRLVTITQGAVGST